jgi:hypothetical protein
VDSHEHNDGAIREGEPPFLTRRNPSYSTGDDQPKPRGALASVVLGLVSVALSVYPGGLVFPLQVFLGEYLPVFLPFLTGALAFGLALRVLVRGRRVSWLAVGGLILGILGMLGGSLIAVLTVYVYMMQPRYTGPQA